MKKLLGTISVLLCWFLVSVVSAEEVMFTLSSKSVAFPDMDVVAHEVHRDGRISRIEFVDNNTKQGSFLAKDFFRLRSLSTFAKQRGYRYFVVLHTEGITAQVIGLLASKKENLGDVLGPANKSLPTDSIIDIEYVKPFVVEQISTEISH